MEGQQKRVAFIVVFVLVILVGSFFSFWQKSSVDENTSSGEVLAKGTHKPEEKSSEIVVYISGAVNKPGVYKLFSNGRVIDLITMAGGLTLDGDAAKINMAQQIKDGMHINVPSREMEAGNGTPTSGASKGKVGDKININSGDKNELDRLPGVGPALAERIIEYRQANGSFNDIEGLKKVPGIGTSKFEKMKEKITI